LEGEHGSSDVKYLIGRSAGRSAVIAGFIATHIATMAGLWFGGARLPTFDFNTLNGYLVLNAASMSLTYSFTHPFENFVLGGAIHYTSGILWGVIFGLIVHPAIGRVSKSLAPLTHTMNLTKGIIWGVTLWIISSALWMPLLIGPLLGPVLTGAPNNFPCGVGPFLTCFGPYGIQALLTNLLWHMIYGVNLGLLFSPTPGSPSSRTWKPSSGVGVR
jgi:hypothetical protein